MDVSQGPKNIQQGFSFSTLEPLSLPADYQNRLNQLLSFNEKVPVVLDTNVLLRLYGISGSWREKAMTFLSELGTSLCIPKMVFEEFQKNREKVVEESPLMRKVLGQNSFALSRELKLYFDSFKGVDTGKAEVLLNALEERKGAVQKLLANDPVMQWVEGLEVLQGLSSEEKDFLKQEFRALDPSGKTPFPGKGDALHKQRFPYGDYFIFHELLKLMAEGQTDVVFLTLDTTKGDWVNRNKEPFPVYLEKVFRGTGHLFGVGDATRIMEKNAGIHFDVRPTRNEERMSENHALLLQGVQVFHPKFGRGVVGERFVQGVAEMVSVDFPQGKRNLLLNRSGLLVPVTWANFHCLRKAIG